MSARRVAALLCAAVAGTAAGAGGDLAVRGALVYTGAGAAIQDGMVWVRGGKIAAVGPAGAVTIPEGVRTISAAVVTPGLIDARATVGLTGILNHKHDQEQLDGSAPLQPELRAIDAYDAREPLVEWLRSFGITTVHTGHAPGAAISGQTLIAKTRGRTVDEAVIVPTAMVAATLGADAKADEPGKPPGTRGKTVAMLRAELIRAQEYRAKRDAVGPDTTKRPARDLRLEALTSVLDGTWPLLVSAERDRDILAALRLRDEFGFRLVLDGAADAPEILEEIARAGVPVIVHPTMARAWGDRENLSMATAARLADAGVTFAFQSGYESYVPKTRVVLFEAAVAAAHGLGPERALDALTRGAARLLGIDDRVGSLEVGKDGDLALFDGDPLETATHCVGTVIEGEVVSDTKR